MPAPFRILHLSDLHLGDDIVWRSVAKLRRWKSPAISSVTKGLSEAIRALQPEYVIVSGDIVNKAAQKTYQDAATCLRRVFTDAGFDLRERVLIVPGNHDVSFFPKRHEDDWKRLELYRAFLLAFYGETDIDSRRPRYSRVDTKHRVIFFCLDSTLKFHRPLAEGELGASQRDWVRRKMRRIESSLPASGAEYVKIAVLHHHCVQIPGTGGQGERFMQLLDGGDTLQMLDDLGFHVVTHGHKHVPHSLQRIRTDTSGLTIVGAGTATCPYVEEQAGHGNNFNVLDFDLSRNALSVRVFRAGAEGRFQGGAEAKNYSLFRSQPLGYAIQEMRKISELSADGTMRTVLEKRNMRVEQPGKEIHYIDVRIIAEAPGSRITGFLPYSSPKFKPRNVEETRIEGQWILETPLKIDGAPVTATYSYALEGGTAMTQSAHTQLYGRDGDTEWTAVIIQNPVDKLLLELQLPTVPRFDVTVRPEGEHLGQKYPSEYFVGKGFRADKTANRYVLEVDHPPIGHRFSLIWELPAKWDPVLGMTGQAG